MFVITLTPYFLTLPHYKRHEVENLRCWEVYWLCFQFILYNRAAAEDIEKLFTWMVAARRNGTAMPLTGVTPENPCWYCNKPGRLYEHSDGFRLTMCDLCGQKLFCPHCTGQNFIGGPEAGGSQNICCSDCGAEYWFDGSLPLTNRVERSPEMKYRLYGPVPGAYVPEEEGGESCKSSS